MLKLCVEQIIKYARMKPAFCELFIMIVCAFRKLLLWIDINFPKYNIVQISSDSDEMLLLFTKMKFFLTKTCH